MRVKNKQLNYESYFHLPQDYFHRQDVRLIFPNPAKPFELELGSGDGEFVEAMAREYPERNFLAVERLLGRARKIAKRAARADLKNMRILRLEARYVVEYLLCKNSVSRLHILFPDPWTKRKKHRYRLLKSDFLALAIELLQNNGELLFKSDSREYYEFVLAELAKLEKILATKKSQDHSFKNSLKNQYQKNTNSPQNYTYKILSWNEKDFFYRQTLFEKQWLEEGRTIYKLRLQKLSI